MSNIIHYCGVSRIISVNCKKCGALILARRVPKGFHVKTPGKTPQDKAHNYIKQNDPRSLNHDCPNKMKGLKMFVILIIAAAILGASLAAL